MESTTGVTIKFWSIRLFSFSFALLFFTHCEARKTMLLSKEISLPKNQNMKHLKILEMAKNLNMLMDVSTKDAETYVSSPMTLPPYDSLPPVALPDINNAPPFCVYPPPNPQSPPSLNPPPNPTGTVPTPTTPQVSPNPPTVFPGPPEFVPTPPTYVPGTPGFAPNPPYYEPSPPSQSTPSPPESVPSPIGFEPSPPVFEPPVVYPPPTVPPPSSRGARGPGVWCVAKPSVPDPIIQEAMNYACGSGADCAPIQPNGSCFQPNTLLEHASYAFNSYWQRTKVAGGTCSFGGTAMLVTVDPGSEGCHFVNY